MAKDPNYVPARNFYIIIKDYEQEVCFILALWAVAIMGYKGFSLRRGQQPARQRTCCGCRRA